MRAALRTTPYDDALCYIPASGVKSSLKDGRLALLNVRTGDIFVGNAIAATVWFELEAGRTIETAAAQLAREYAVRIEDARRDAREFAQRMVAAGLLRRSPTMPRRRSSIVWSALWELIRYDLMMTLFGFSRIYAEMTEALVAGNSETAAIETAVVEAVNMAGSFYWKPVMCLQRSVAATRLLRRYGVAAGFVIGYRSEPFFSHAWVEVAGRVVNDAPAYARCLAALVRLS
jgi:Transglutaminase-like superfamily/Coenzyme PQQ synthesis protein D (PqqD)